MPKPPRMEAAGHTHPGRQRRHNEDSFGVHLDLGLFVVADGMGGHAGGDVASRIAVSTVTAHIKDAGIQGASSVAPPGPERGAVAPPPEAAPRAGDLLVAAVKHANLAIVGAAREMPGESNMGTTIACVLVRGTRAAVAHVGDSRVYRYREGRLETLTDDHSLLAECLRSGYLAPEMAGAFPYKHLVTRSLGADEAVQVDSRLIEPLPGDLVLLCSDGLSGVVDDHEIAKVLEGAEDLSTAAHELVDRANDKGGPDNVTAVLVRWLP